MYLVYRWFFWQSLTSPWRKKDFFGMDLLLYVILFRCFYCLYCLIIYVYFFWCLVGLFCSFFTNLIFFSFSSCIYLLTVESNLCKYFFNPKVLFVDQFLLNLVTYTILDVLNLFLGDPFCDRLLESSVKYPSFFLFQIMNSLSY